MASANRILVVDDESNIVVLCQHLLELAGYQVSTATSPQEGLQFLENHLFDLILTDIRLPEMDGFDLVERARAVQPDIAVVIMTGYRTVETAIKALRSGVDGLVIKPYELGPEMVESVKNALEQRRVKDTSVSIERLQPLFKVSGALLMDNAPRSLEKRLAQAAAELCAAQHVGVYRSGEQNGDLKRISMVGTLPESEHTLWQSQPVKAALATQDHFQFRCSSSARDGLQDLLESLGWGGFLLAAIRRRRETLLFLAARDRGEAVFTLADIELLALLTQQSAAKLENARYFSSMVDIAARVERNSGVLQRAGKMAVQERLLPPLLHEIDLPLQAVKNNLYLAGRGDAPVERMRSYLATGQKEMYRFEQLLQRIQALTQPDTQERTTLDIEQVILQALDQLQLVLKEEVVQVKLNIARPLPAVLAIREQVEQVLYHLILNALDAMKTMQGERIVWVDVVAEDGFVNVRIEDSGEGFASGVEANLFKPFFTTRADGSGLGLMLSQKNIAAQGGELRNASAEQQHGAGAVFLLRLPLSD